ncbi:MAG TPA: hypothetical protein VJM49_19625, partial [Acidimicrobiales bacterium]|nr:hypothetical protein [Acidimicrobiales bacterium]
PYGPVHERRRKTLIVPGAVCHKCGAQATELDHVPPLSQHRHVEGSGCCRSLPACGPCQRRQGYELGWRGAPVPVESGAAVEEPDDSPGPEHPVWDVAPWLDELRDVPVQATWPRFMTLPHHAAVGSYGAEAIEWLADEARIELRWFQELGLTRQLEHDDDGVLVWLIVLATTARQVGKSVWLRGGATWRLHQADRWGEEQTIMHTGKDLPVCKEVQRLARAWAKARGYPVREQNGNEEITEPISDSRWMVRGKDSVYGYSVSNGLVDEAWGVAAGVVEDGIEPTMAERVSPQLVLASTGHSKATSLFPTHRLAALDELDAPDSTLIVEWSARRDAEIDDRAAWRQASPHWSKGRQRLIESRLKRVQSGELLDPDESDPVESFRSQFLNIWPVRTAKAVPVIDPAVWAACRDDDLCPTGTYALSLEFTTDRDHGAVVCAGDAEGVTALAVLEHSSDIEALVARAAKVSAEWGAAVVIDKSGPAASAIPALERAGATVMGVALSDVVRACGDFHDAANNARLAHRGDDRLTDAVKAATKRRVADAWVWRRGGADLSPLIAGTLARWGVVTALALVPAVH